jgi:hydroxypyruvate isomerase
MKLCTSIELLFTEAGSEPGDRVRAAAEAGVHDVEIWQHSNKDLGRLRRALDDNRSRLWTLLVESRVPLADRNAHAPWLEQVGLACKAARELGCPYIVTGSGTGFPFMRRAQQSAIVVEALKAGAEVAARHDVVLLLENLNTRVDHPGTLFDHLSDCVGAIRAVDGPGIGLLFDLYHALQMRESATAELREHAALIRHVQIADLPNRSEPGSGSVDWPARLREVRALGYDGPVGLECTPTTDSKSAIAYARRVLAEA